MLRHIFLTGEKQVGKSTLIQRVLDASGLVPAGFQTLPLWIGGTRKGCYFHSLVSLGDPFQNDTPAVLRLGQREHQALPFVFESLGVLALEHSLKSPAPLLLMDEMGKAEKDCPAFQRAVASCLDGEKPVLGVLQRGEYPLRERIAQREDTLILSVTEENREAALPRLISLVLEAVAGTGRPGGSDG